MTQFPDVPSTYGAPMGRRQAGWTFQPGFIPHRFIRAYRVRINSGGYDDGGAYWGIGAPLYCVESIADGCDFQKFIRAGSRQAAADHFDIPASWLVRR